MAQSTNVSPNHSELPDDQPTWDVARAYRAQQTPPPPGPIRYERFLDWLDEDTLAEWVDGAVVMTSPASLRHQLIAAFLDEILAQFVRLHDLGIIIPAPFQMKLRHSGREPDVIFVAKAHLDRLKPTFVEGPADLVIEIISPESVERDRGAKFTEYSAAGIPEHWLSDPLVEEAEFYQLDASGRAYQQIAPDADGAYHSLALPGFWLRGGWLWEQPLPTATQTLLTIDIDAYASYLQQQLRNVGL